MSHFRAMSECLRSALRRPVVRLAFCFRVDRSDGISFGFTTHNRHLRISGLLYLALAAVEATNLRQEAGGEPDNMDVIGVLTSECITDEDLVAGRYDDAQVTVFAVDWGDLSAGIAGPFFRGNIGDVTVDTGTYKASVRSLMQRFKQAVGELYSPGCRVFALGDARCTVNLAGNTVQGRPITSNVTVSTVVDQEAFRLDGAVEDAGFYSYGTLRATSGKNTGFVREVKLHSESDTADEEDVVPTPSTASDLAYRKPTVYTPSQTFSFAIPAGSWDSAVLTLQTSWTLDGSELSPDNVNMQAPPGQANDVLVQSASAAGSYEKSLPLGAATLVAINAAAGGPFSVALRHTSPSEGGGAPFFHVNVSSFVLALVGTADVSSDRVVLHERFPFDVEAGDSFVAVAGCNRLPNTCSGKFDNIFNFRGEPNVPGIDRLLQTGRAPQ